MQAITLRNGVAMPLIGFGTVKLFDEVCEAAVCSAMENGYRMIDCAHMYGNEDTVGRGIARGLAATGLKREDLFLVSKVNDRFTSYEKTKEGVRLSLKQLGTDYLDLYLIHEPYPEAAEMYRALEEDYEAGLLRAIGISNFNETGYLRFLEQVRIPPMVNQIECHPLHQQLAFQQLMAEHGTVAEAWAPFGSGNAGVGENETLIAIGEKYGKTPHQVVLRYDVQCGIPAIPRSSNPGRQQQNIAVFDFELTGEEMAAIRALDTGRTLYDWMEDWNRANS